jgi:SAM-dependent methyltransferase
MRNFDLSETLSASFVQDDLGVWIPREGVSAFGYSDGRWVERYLESVLRGAKDLSSDSEELERHIKDWNTEYHLTRKRKNLLAGLKHPRGARVLEIGCGCGAVTRLIGERYDSVIAAEGSYSRARLARLRTADLPNVEVVCSPYQNLGLQGTIDIVFCIGVLEYAPTYVKADDPFATALTSMKDMLRPEGSLVLAIENKLGLKYFANSTEDHSGTFFEGIEGYPRLSHEFETFGRIELLQLLKKYYDDVSFYYPFPDYKIPSALLSDEAMATLDVGELLGSMIERDYAGRGRMLFDNRLAWPQAVANGLARDLANSFLVVASNGQAKAPVLDRLGVLFNSERRAKFVTETSIERDGDHVQVRKIFVRPEDAHSAHVDTGPCSSEWISRPTVAYELFRNALARRKSSAEVVAPVRAWWNYINERAALRSDGLVDGALIDAVWHNCCVLDDGGLALFDQELSWKSPIPAKELFIRAAVFWGRRYRKDDMPELGRGTLKSAVRKLAAMMDIELSAQDFRNFVEREALLQSEIGLVSEARATKVLAWQLGLPKYEQAAAARQRIIRDVRRARNLLRRFVGR